MVGNEIKFNKKVLRNICEHRIVKERKADLREFPPELDRELITSFKCKGINKLYSHQRAAVDAILQKKNTVITTGVDSGKSLCYQIPVLHSLQKDTQTRALFLFPTKALTQDQMLKFSELVTDLPSFNPITGIYDGDTSAEKRRVIKRSANLLFTNPDMLHLGILPHHTNWAEFFKNLKFIVIDEVHMYRGIFGSHFSNVIRRLKRVASFYSADPVFILTSATLSNVKDFA
ncbi:MAG: DEAD/DEAH box helicase, partial [Melioribacteraceae bacterium]|nr:DEAD/DEAH box helicase [Melioribacteraceae bacterium]